MSSNRQSGAASPAPQKLGIYAVARVETLAVWGWPVHEIASYLSVPVASVEEALRDGHDLGRYDEMDDA